MEENESPRSFKTKKQFKMMVDWFFMLTLTT